VIVIRKRREFGALHVVMLRENKVLSRNCTPTDTETHMDRVQSRDALIASSQGPCTPGVEMAAEGNNTSCVFTGGLLATLVDGQDSEIDLEDLCDAGCKAAGLEVQPFNFFSDSMQGTCRQLRGSGPRQVALGDMPELEPLDRMATHGIEAPPSPALEDMPEWESFDHDRMATHVIEAPLSPATHNITEATSSHSTNVDHEKYSNQGQTPPAYSKNEPQ